MLSTDGKKKKFILKTENRLRSLANWITIECATNVKIFFSNCVAFSFVSCCHLTHMRSADALFVLKRGKFDVRNFAASNLIMYVALSHTKNKWKIKSVSVFPVRDIYALILLTH